MSRQVNQRTTRRVVAGADSYDSLNEQEQAVVREEWANRARALRDKLNYEARFAETGQSYSETDADGNLIVHPART